MWSPPEPADKDYVAMVRDEIAQASIGARELVGVNLVVHREKSLWFRPAICRGKTRGTCKGCGCGVDDFTPGCHNCSGRHAMRRTHARRRAGILP